MFPASYRNTIKVNKGEIIMTDFWKTTGMAGFIFILTLYTSFGIALEHSQSLMSTLIVFAIVACGLTIIVCVVCEQRF